MKGYRFYRFDYVELDNSKHDGYPRAKKDFIVISANSYESAEKEAIDFACSREDGAGDFICEMWNEQGKKIH